MLKAKDIMMAEIITVHPEKEVQKMATITVNA
jgi:hypothetical protein